MYILYSNYFIPLTNVFPSSFTLSLVKVFCSSAREGWEGGDGAKKKDLNKSLAHEYFRFNWNKWFSLVPHHTTAPQLIVHNMPTRFLLSHSKFENNLFLKDLALEKWRICFWFVMSVISQNFHEKPDQQRRREHRYTVATYFDNPKVPSKTHSGRLYVTFFM